MSGSDTSAENSAPATTDRGRPDWGLRVPGAVLGVAVFLLALHILRLLTEAIRMAGRRSLPAGLQEFGSTLLIIAGALILTTLLMRACASLFGAGTARIMERRRLRTASRQARDSIERKKELMEERIRLTTRLRATWMYERECYGLANTQARQEFQAALQSSVTRSCELTFDQISLAIEQYEQMVQEIETSPLEAGQKTELLDQLTSQLNVAAAEDRNRSTERLMQDEVWKLRIETAKRLQKTRPSAAIRYLKEVEASNPPSAGRRKIQAILRRLEEKSAVQK